jgi:hypothetical protein
MTGLETGEDNFWSRANKLRADFGLLDLLSTAPVRSTAQELLELVETIGVIQSEALRTNDSESAREVVERSTALPGARSAFRDAARKELGIPTL